MRLGDDPDAAKIGTDLGEAVADTLSETMPHVRRRWRIQATDDSPDIITEFLARCRDRGAKPPVEAFA